MKLTEAYTILNLDPSATPEEAKKQYRKLAKQFHPDINKDADAEAKFKKINEAYEIVESGVDPEQPAMDWNNPFGHGHGNRHVYDPFSAIFNRGNSAKRQYNSTNIEIQTSISFRESVQGCKKEISYSRQTKCPHCHGSGNKPVNNGCKKCGGKGQVTTQSAGSIFITTCPSCHGHSQTNPCTPCSSTGVTEAEASVHVSVPAAVVDGKVLRLRGMGNFAGTLMGLQDQFTDVYLHIKVKPDADMRLVGEDVVSDLNVSLLDALRGCSSNIKTIDGDKMVDVPAGTKNKDEVILSVGDHNIKHRVIIGVSYPTDVNKLIDVLLEEGK
jgi:molecular chaperone DnaJ